VVQAGSFSKAARLLAMPNTTVSAKVARLEEQLGVTLLRRTTRKLHVTKVGQAYFEKCLRGLTDIESAEKEISAELGEPRGLLRVTTIADVAHNLLAPIAAQYTQTYPKTKLEVVVRNDWVDLVEEGIDLAIRPTIEVKDSTLVIREFVSVASGLWASPEYLAKRGIPRTPAELRAHDGVRFTRPGHALRLSDGHEELDVPMTERAVADDLQTLRALILHGLGIGPLVDFLARPYEREGKLVQVLPGWTWSAGGLSFLYPSQPFLPPTVRAFIDLAIEFGRKPAERAMILQSAANTLPA